MKKKIYLGIIMIMLGAGCTSLGPKKQLTTKAEPVTAPVAQTTPVPQGMIRILGTDDGAVEKMEALRSACTKGNAEACEQLYKLLPDDSMEKKRTKEDWNKALGRMGTQGQGDTDREPVRQ